MSRLFILGASDPEMAAIERLLTECGERFAYACVDGQRVHPGNAYRAAGCLLNGNILDDWDGPVIVIECGGSAPVFAKAKVLDHHRPGDYGFGLPPERFLEASSIGQLIAFLATDQTVIVGMFKHSNYDMNQDHTRAVAGEFRQLANGTGWWVGMGEVHGRRFGDHVPKQYVLAAAADHCLGAAYQGECPGVDPDALMRWRVETRAAFQQRPDLCRRCGDVRVSPGWWAGAHDMTDEGIEIVGGVSECGDLHDWMSCEEQILADVEAARKILRDAIAPREGGEVRPEFADLRGQWIPELPEAAAREGIPFLASVRERDGREKVVLQTASPDLVQRFLAGELVSGLTGYYGDPARGFAGGYVA